MSIQEHAASLKIQESWRKYLDSKDSCAICMNTIGKDCCTTECGHKFCTGCLLKAVQRNGSCPLCRKELIENIVEDDDYEIDHMQEGFPDAWDMTMEAEYTRGYTQGRLDAEEDIYLHHREEIEIAKQQAYDEGIIAGRSFADKDLDILRKKIEAYQLQIKYLKQKHKF